MRAPIIDTLVAWLLGRPRPVPFATGETVLPLAPRETYEFVPPATLEPTSPDVVDEWLATQERAPAAMKTSPAEWDLDGLCEPTPQAAGTTQPAIESDTPRGAGEWEGELQLFLADDLPTSSSEGSKNPRSSEEWPVDLLLDNEWSVSRLVH